MEADRIIFFRNFLFRTFLIGVLFAIFLGVMTLVFWDLMTSLSERFFKIDEKELGEIMLTFFLQVRIILLFLFLAPTLALHWMLSNGKRHS